jgi:FlaA1/EpsC-like NDP-sugar epimerase
MIISGPTSAGQASIWFVLQNVEIRDLLGRETVRLECQGIGALLRNKCVTVTGAGGSIGSELARQIAAYNPESLLLVDRSAEALAAVERELDGECQGRIVASAADILDSGRMRELVKQFKPAILFHAAADKHVTLMEDRPAEAIRNNAIGTALLADLALEKELDQFVLISTDKAIHPTSVMGATKRLAEIYVQALSASAGHKTKFMAVRFGNVLGSSGSVIPIFQRQIAEGGPVTVTHPEVTRYFMTVSEAAGLVLQAASQGTGGEIFVLDMGKPVKILDLARDLIRLSGFEPEKDIPIQIIGLRPGEKLFEELSYKGENIATTSHPKIMRFVSEAQSIEKVRALFGKLQNQAATTPVNELKLVVQEGVPEYQPYLGA